ncbi:hypothetical protein SAMN05421830_101408 [Desulfomicrobium norvegicum]|uniref:Uncharacterized protein n=1 Tax=Desulfomicrobium norvegicum (strain DSM 1741 / NCIMB 8310) TaxID=52561 RepID=A0A8G2BZY6_DESNO|nr:hypothetical protein [Desulfomicrobium norvegicum]SFL29280.1 hypothetical protein SAMN05421830_101408 [Desulfomicrobium norvegicum]
MALSIDNFFRQTEVGATQSDQKVYVRQDEKLAKTSAFSIFQGHARARENDKTAKAFLGAIRRDPVYSKYIDIAKEVLDANRQEGKPLRTRHIAMVREQVDRQLSLDLGQAIAFGQQLAKEGVIPDGFGTSFGQFCMTHALGGQAVNGEALPGELLRDFLQTEVVGQHVAKLCRDRGMGDVAVPVAAILSGAGLVSEGMNRAFEDPDMDARALRFTDVMGVLEGTLSKALNVLQDLQNGKGLLEEFRGREDMPQRLQTMIQAVDSHAISRDELGTFYISLDMEHQDVRTPAGQSEAVRSFQVNTLGASVCEKLLAEQGLPTNLGSPLAHHPDVQSEARKALDILVPAPTIPSEEQAKTALEGALRAFMGKNLPAVREFVAMSANPPAELKPKALSPETLPRFINVLLEEGGMLDPLLGGDMPPDFLQRVERHSHVVQSCSHGVSGDFGTDDFINVQRGAIQLLLAQRGVEGEEYKELLQNTVDKFGPLASELATVSMACDEGKLTGRTSDMQKAAMVSYLTLETHLRAILVLVPKDALDDVPGADFNQQVGNLVDKTFQRELSLDELSAPVRAFVLNAIFDSIDGLPEPQGRAVVSGAFTPEQKAVMKDMVISTGLRDMEMITRLAGMARDGASSIGNMCRDQNTVVNISEAVLNMTGQLEPLIREMKNDPAAKLEGVLGGALMMAIGFSGQDQAGLRAMFDSLDGELGQQVAGAVMHVAETDIKNQPRMLAAIRVMEELRLQSGARLGITVERDPLHFTRNVSERHQIPGLLMDKISSFAPRSFSDLDIRLGQVIPPLGSAQLQVLHSIAGRLETSVPPHQRALIPGLLQGNARSLLAAQESNGEQPLSPSQIWRAVTGHAVPKKLTENALGGRLLGHVVSTYDQALRIACPDMFAGQRDVTVFTAFFQGLSFPKLMELTLPGARLTQDDVAVDLGMSSLRDYTPDNAYGLTTDFRRRGRNTVMRFEASDGRVLQTSPFGIPDAENVPSHPHFQEIVDHAQSMSASPAQKARMLQAFSQAALVMSRLLSTTFPGIEFSEHGNFSVTATQREDTTVVINIDSDPGLPLRFHQQYIIEPNGDHRCSEFVMERR